MSGQLPILIVKKITLLHQILKKFIVYPSEQLQVVDGWYNTQNLGIPISFYPPASIGYSPTGFQSTE